MENWLEFGLSQLFFAFICDDNNALVKQSKMIAQQSKTLKKPNIVDIKSGIIEHTKTTHKLTKPIRQTEKVSQIIGPGKNSNKPSYSKTKNGEILSEKKLKNNETINLMVIKVIEMLIVSKYFNLLILTYSLKLLIIELRIS